MFYRPGINSFQTANQDIHQIDRAIATLKSMNLDVNNTKKQTGCKNISVFDSLRLLAVLRFLQMLKDNPRNKVRASGAVADVMFRKSGASYRARTIRDWADHYLVHLELPLLRQGKYQKTKSLNDDEDVKTACLSFLRSIPAERRNADSFQRWIISDLRSDICIDYDLSVSKCTATNWIIKLDF
jgi:hypothetical protein